MKLKKLLPLLSVFLAVPLVGCGGGGTTSQETTSITSSEPAPSSEKESSPEESSEGGKELKPLGEPGVAFHYRRDDGEYVGWNLWLWKTGGDGKAYDFNYEDDYGMIGYYALSTWGENLEEINFIVRTDSWDKDPDGDRTVTFSDYKMDDNQIYHVYLYTGDATIYPDPSIPLSGIVKSAVFNNEKKITVTGSANITELELFEDEVSIYKETLESPKKVVAVEIKDFTIDYYKTYTYKAKLATGNTRTGEVSITNLYGRDSFNDAFYYDGELGAIYTPAATTFRVWSPFSASIDLMIYSTGTPAALGGSDEPLDIVSMAKGEKGVFEATIEGDMQGKYYTYLVNNNKFKNKEIVDPYAKSAGVNGLRGMVVDFSRTNPLGWDEIDYLQYDRKELTVYETHVADVTSSATWTGTEEYRKLFKGMYEQGTEYTEGDVTVSTGFDHIKELGVNAVQIIPFFDQANDETNMTFNWGYNPLNYNVVEGGYSTNPYDGYQRIIELKELIQAYNKAGIEIIMDVVYNHVASADGSNFDVLMPGYYFRYSGGSLSNGSGCGNETASDHAMFRKFMIDSTSFWLEEYKLGGFRFDLMALHDLETMNQLTAEAQAINPNVCIYGEPWNGGSSPLADFDQAKQSNAKNFEGYGQFNDQIRDALHGGVFDDKLKTLGWCDNNAKTGNSLRNKIVAGLVGETFGATNDPDKTTNYVSCHDNRTLYDRIVATGKYDVKAHQSKIIGMIDVAHAMVFLSEGTSFMLAGEEFARTKGGDHNSYQSSYKVNELDYALKIKNHDLFEHFQNYIQLKQELSLLHLGLADMAKESCTVETDYDSTNSIITLKVEYNGEKLAVVYHNGFAGDADYSINLEGYELVYSNQGLTEIGAATVVAPYGVLVAKVAAAV